MYKGNVLIQFCKSKFLYNVIFERMKAHLRFHFEYDLDNLKMSPHEFIDNYLEFILFSSFYVFKDFAYQILANRHYLECHIIYLHDQIYKN